MLTMFQSTRKPRSRNAKVRARRATLESLETRQLLSGAGSPAAAVVHAEVHMVFGETLRQAMPGAIFIMQNGVEQTQSNGVAVNPEGYTYLNATDANGPDHLTAGLQNGTTEDVTVYVAKADWAISANSFTAPYDTTAHVLDGTLTSVTGPAIAGLASSVLPVQFHIVQTADASGVDGSGAGDQGVTTLGMTPAITNAGTYTITPVVDSGLTEGCGVSLSSDVNFTVLSSAQVVINPGTLTVHTNANTKTVGQTAHDSGTVTGQMGSDVITADFASNGDVSTAVHGSYAITSTLHDPHGVLTNYVVNYTPASLTVDPAPVFGSITADSKYFDGTDAATTTNSLTTRYLFSFDNGTVHGTAWLTVQDLGNGMLLATGGTLTVTGAYAGTYQLVTGGPTSFDTWTPGGYFRTDNILYPNSPTVLDGSGYDGGMLFSNGTLGVQIYGHGSGMYEVDTASFLDTSYTLGTPTVANVNLGQATLAGVTLHGTATFDGSNAGAHTVTLNNPVLAGANASDYVLMNTAPITANAIISAITVNPIVSIASREYNGQPDYASAILVGPHGDTSWMDSGFTYEYYTFAGVSLGSTAPTNAGSYAVKASYPGDNNYLPSYSIVSFDISKVVTHIVVDSQTIGYGQTPDAFTGTVTPVNPASYMGGIDPVIYGTELRNIDGFYNAGTHTIYAGWSDPNTNYTVSVTLGTLTVNQAHLTVTPIVGGGILYNGFIGHDSSVNTTDGQDLAANVSASSTDNGNGTTTIRLTGPTSLTNYAVSYVPVTYSNAPVAPPSLGITGYSGSGYSSGVASSYSGGSSSMPDVNAPTFGLVLDTKIGSATYGRFVLRVHSAT